jgi:hypothetical protein
MSPNKTSLHEVASDANALKIARSEPIQQEEAPRQTMDFIRSLVLDLPIQTTRDVVESTTQIETPAPVQEPNAEQIASLKKLAGIR